MTVLWEVGWLLKVSSEHLFAHILAPTADNCKGIYEPFHNDGPYIFIGREIRGGNIKSRAFREAAQVRRLTVFM